MAISRAMVNEISCIRLEKNIYSLPVNEVEHDFILICIQISRSAKSGQKKA
jgi:hypothetical protein